MKIWKYLSLVAIAMFTLHSCSNDFDLTSDYKEIPVIYALLNATDTAQYFRVERAFIDEQTSGLELAQRPDSLYYNDATVSVTRLSTGDTWFFDRVDGAAEGYPRNSGVFAQSPNYLYKKRTSEMELVPEEEYELKVQLGEGQKTVSSKTTLVKPPLMASPVDGGNINLEPQRNTNYFWQSNSTLHIFDAFIDFFYTQSDTPDTLSVRWSLAKGSLDNEGTESNTDFFQKLASDLTASPNITRREQGASFYVVSGGKEMSEYVRITQANLGITSSDAIPLYEGSFGKDATGIFSSRHTMVRDSLILTTGTIDSLKNSVITRDLNF